MPWLLSETCKVMKLINYWPSLNGINGALETMIKS